MTKHARLKPYDAKKGHVLRGITLLSLGRSFQEGKLYEVSDGDAEKLARVHSRVDDESSPLAFDVGTEKEIRDMILREEKLRLGIRSDAIEMIQDPKIGAITSEDVTGEPEIKQQVVTNKPSQRPRRGG